MKQLLTTSVLILLICSGTSANYVRQDKNANTAQVSEVTMERIWDNCGDCGDYKVILRKTATGPYQDVSVIYIDTKSNKQRHGKLYSYHWAQLTRLLEAQRYFEFKDSYGLGVVDTLITKTSVIRGGKRKEVLNNAGGWPIALCGIESAIDGVVARVKWEDK